MSRTQTRSTRECLPASQARLRRKIGGAQPGCAGARSRAVACASKVVESAAHFQRCRERRRVPRGSASPRAKLASDGRSAERSLAAREPDRAQSRVLLRSLKVRRTFNDVENADAFHAGVPPREPSSPPTEDRRSAAWLRGSQIARSR